MRRSSGNGQVEPTAALAAVLAVCVGLSIYGGVVEDVVSPGGLWTDPGATARQTADAVADAARSSGAVIPGRLNDALDAGPSGHRVNATLLTVDRRWTAGPAAPDRATSARIRVSARVGPADVDPATLRVEVWR